MQAQTCHAQGTPTFPPRTSQIITLNARFLHGTNWRNFPRLRASSILNQIFPVHLTNLIPPGESTSPSFHFLFLFLSFSRSYAARLSFYKLKQFQCEVTGKSGLDYFQALESEQQEARTLHTRFPQHLKAPVLRAVQWRTCFHQLTSSHFHSIPDTSLSPSPFRGCRASRSSCRSRIRAFQRPLL